MQQHDMLMYCSTRQESAAYALMHAWHDGGTQVERLVAAEEAAKRTPMERARSILRAIVAGTTPLHVKVAST